MKGGLAVILGAVKALRGLGLAPLAPGAAAVGRRGGVHRQRRAAVRGQRPPGRRVRRHRAVPGVDLDLAGRRALVPRRHRGPPGARRRRPGRARTRSRRRSRSSRRCGGSRRSSTRARRRRTTMFEHPINLNVGVVRGGDWPSTVAAECTLSCRLALFPGQHVAWLQARVEEAVAERGRGASVPRRPSAARPLRRLRLRGRRDRRRPRPRDHALGELRAGSRERRPSSCRRPRRPTRGSSSSEGIPAVCFGAWAENVHGVDERVNIPSMISAAQVLAVFIRDWCGLGRMRARTVALLGIVVALVGGAGRASAATRAAPVGRRRRRSPSAADDGRGRAGAGASRREPVGAPRLCATRSARSRAARARASLRGISEIRRFFRTNETPIWFVSATPFNLLGIDRWVRNFSYLNYYDSFDGTHPNVFVPQHVAPPTFDSIEEICNYLLAHKEVIDHVKARGRRQGGLPDVRRGDGAARRARRGSRSRSRRRRSATGSTRRS